VAATLQVADDLIFVDRFFPGFPNGHAFEIKETAPPPADDTLPVYLDVRSVKNPGTKARNVRYRVAASPGWSLSFTLLWDRTIVSREQMEAVVGDAGQLVGLADARSIGFGRFKVKSFEAAET
jgi:hypothetical protein